MDASATPIALYLTAVSLGFLHTLLGPDHYIPFVAMARVGHWSLARTLAITTLCGIGHVASSAVLGLIGVSAGIVLFRLETLEAVRGRVAGWLLLGFGVMYFAWGLRRSIRNQPHTHLHAHTNGTLHSHAHSHQADHFHVHDIIEGCKNPSKSADSMTPWLLFTIFLFGPCEPLIPLVMYPAANGRFVDLLLVTCVFGATTISTMLCTVALLYLGFAALPVTPLGRHTHTIAGLSIIACAAVIFFFGT
ncbi:MAG: hypothetical protein AABZ08_11885 [Planctomycetota bacterium]